MAILLCGDLELNPGPAYQPSTTSGIPDDAFKCLPKKGLTFIHLNIRSVRNKVDEIHNVLQSNSQRIGVMGLTESWLNSEFTNNLLSTSGFATVRNDRNRANSSKSRGGGIVAFIRDNVPFIRRSDLELPTIEMIALEVSPVKSKPIIVIFIYRPPDDRRSIEGWLTNIGGDNCAISHWCLEQIRLSWSFPIKLEM